MKSRTRFLGELLVLVGVSLVVGWLLLGLFLRAFPVNEHPWVVWMNVLALSLVYGLIWMAIVIAALPGEWAPRGVWRLTLFNFGFVFISRKEQGKQVNAMKKAGYITWALSKNWVACPSIPGWLMRLGRWARTVWSEG